MRARRSVALAGAVATAMATLVGTGVAAATTAGSHGSGGRSGSSASCRLDNGITHVVGLQFDNVHLTRDTPSVPSDLEQMPHLLGFLQGQGSLLSQDHDVLSHTATNVLADQTGLYQDRHGIAQSNSYRYFNPDGTTGGASSFAYWTDPLYDSSNPTPTDTTYTMAYKATRTGPAAPATNTPAPWVPFTRAGCDVGDVGVGNTVLENIGKDIPTVFGPGSPQAAEAAANPAKATADVVGLAVHCAAASSRCASGQVDALPDEPGGYAGYHALFGSTEVAPAISAAPVRSLSGRTITDSKGNVGFPGFDALTPDNALGYVADMQESGVPVTYAYLSDAHSAHGSAFGDYGPGEPGYTAQLRSYDAAFATFLSRLAGDGITAKNTLFVVTTDEGDHFVGSAPSPAGCDGVTTPCSYAAKGEINVNLPGLLAAQTGDTTPFTMHSDPAPVIYVTGNPERTDPAVRGLEKHVAGLTYTDPRDGSTKTLTHLLADPVEEQILHYVDADPARTPTFTVFAGEDEYVYQGAKTCGASCISEPPAYAWNHGGVWPDMTTIWLGLVGPGVRHAGLDATTWADQTDVRPTTLALLGLHDDYQVDGRVLVEDLRTSVLPRSLREDRGTLLALGREYKALIAGAGQFAHSTLVASTAGLTSTTAGDVRYLATEQALRQLGARRDAVAQQMSSLLLGAAFDGRAVDERRAERLMDEGNELLRAAAALARA